MKLYHCGLSTQGLNTPGGGNPYDFRVHTNLKGAPFAKCGAKSYFALTALNYGISTRQCPRSNTLSGVTSLGVKKASNPDCEDAQINRHR